MTENLSLWNKVKRPPESALKKITGGRLSGKTDISPQWRLQVITENLGPCGIGWKYEIKRLWLEEGTENQKAAFAEISLFIKKSEPSLTEIDGYWSDPIPGVGGSMFIVKESSGLHTSDEAFKMAITDALSVAMKALGVGSDIYMGLHDGSKYKHTENENPKIHAISPDQVIEIDDLLTETRTDRDKFLSFYGAKTLNTFPSLQYAHALKVLQDKRNKMKEAAP